MEEHPGSWLNALVALEPEWLRPYLDVYVLHALVIVAFLALLAWLTTRRLSLIPRSKLQSFGEWVYEGLAGLTRSIIPHNGERYTNILGTFFLFILCLNLFGLIPGFLSPTSRMVTTGALGIMSILLAQWVGLRANGLGYLRRWIPRMIGVPSFLIPFLFPLMFILHIIEELVKPMSLAIRLFGNVFGDETSVTQFALLGAGFLGTLLNPTGASALVQVGGFLGLLLSVGITAVMVSFAIFVAFIQALVFSILSGAYLLFALELE
ncbi:MAG: F0F1 ATP synthase subunit A [candidate division WS1 bacterium]|jgi:F-type H+-transporting ATPase subunit a|nr:F0F1 ATP synthase subunit A [candidate division WS1 bacterium]